MTVSIIIPCYNCEKYLAQAMESAINQTYEDTEVIVADDNSTDNSIVIAQITKEKYPDKRITILANTKNLGVTKTRAIALEVASGEYYLPLDSDDFIELNYIEKAIPVLEKNKNAGFVYSNAIYFDEKQERKVESPEYSFFNLVFGNYINYCSLFRKSCYKAVGGYDLNNRGYWEDYQHYINLGRHAYYGIHINDFMFHYRIRSGSATQSSFIMDNADAIKSYIISKYPEVFPTEWIERAKEILKSKDADFMKVRH